MSVAVQTIMEGMPGAADLRRLIHDGRCVVMAGSRAVAAYDEGDAVLRNMTAVTLTELGFSGRRVAEVLGLTPEYVSELRGQVRREGSAGLFRAQGRPLKLSAVQVRQARAGRGGGEPHPAGAPPVGGSRRTEARAGRGA